MNGRRVGYVAVGYVLFWVLLFVMNQSPIKVWAKVKTDALIIESTGQYEAATAATINQDVFDNLVFEDPNTGPYTLAELLAGAIGTVTGLGAWSNDNALIMSNSTAFVVEDTGIIVNVGGDELALDGIFRTGGYVTGIDLDDGTYAIRFMEGSVILLTLDSSGTVMRLTAPDGTDGAAPTAGVAGILATAGRGGVDTDAGGRSAAGGAQTISAGLGGNVYGTAYDSLGGVGGALALASGAGGHNQSSGAEIGKAGDGGLARLRSGDGGSSYAAGGEGGDAGDLRLTSGDGGQDTEGSSGTGGDAGDLEMIVGEGGLGDTPGADGFFDVYKSSKADSGDLLVRIWGWAAIEQVYVGGGYGSTGITMDADGNLRVDGISELEGQVNVGGGYGDSGITMGDNGALSANGYIVTDSYIHIGIGTSGEYLDIFMLDDDGEITLAGTDPDDLKIYSSPGAGDKVTFFDDSIVGTLNTVEIWGKLYQSPVVHRYMSFGVTGDEVTQYGELSGSVTYIRSVLDFQVGNGYGGDSGGLTIVAAGGALSTNGNIVSDGNVGGATLSGTLAESDVLVAGVEGLDVFHIDVTGNGILDAGAFTDEDDLDVAWDGDWDVWINGTIINLASGSSTIADNDTTYFYATVAGDTTMQESTTKPTGEFALIAECYTYGGDIEHLHVYDVISHRIESTEDHLDVLHHAIVANGLIVAPDVDATNPNDFTIASGVWYLKVDEALTVASTLYSAGVGHGEDLTYRYYHDTSVWTRELSNGVDFGFWDDGTNKDAVSVNNWYRANIFLVGIDEIEYVYPQVEHTLQADAVAEAITYPPYHLDFAVPLASLIFRGSASAFGTTAYFLDTRPLHSRGAGGSSTAIQNVWLEFTADSGSATANSSVDSFAITGGTNIGTAIVGDEVTVNVIDAPDFVGPVDIGGGYGSTGATITTGGVGRFDGLLIMDSATIGGGYGDTGITGTSAGALQMNGALTVDDDATFATQVAINRTVDNDISLAVTAVDYDIGLVNGTFTGSLTPWGSAGGWSYGTNDAHWDVDGGGGGALTQTPPTGFVDAHEYELTFTVSNSAGSFSVTPDINGVFGTGRGGDGTFTETIIASGNGGVLSFVAGGGSPAEFDIDDVTIFDTTAIAVDAKGSFHTDGDYLQDTPAFPGTDEQAITQIENIETTHGQVIDSTLGSAMGRIRRRVEQDFADEAAATDWLTAQVWFFDGRFIRATTAPLRLLTFFDDSGDTSQTVTLRRGVANQLTRDIPTSYVLTLEGDSDTTWTLADDVTTATLVYNAGLDATGTRLRAAYVTYHHSIGRGVNRLDAAIVGLSRRTKTLANRVSVLEAQVLDMRNDFEARLQALEN